MILFKRVGESFRHIEDREWVLLALETLGVLVGILIAFELQQWGQQRSDAAKHRQLMERLFEESEMDVAVIREMRDRLNELLAGEKMFAAGLAAGQCPPEAQWEAVETIGMLPALTAPTSVYQELMGAGGLSSVQRRDVRNSIAVFHGELEWSQQQIAYFRQVKEDPVPNRDPRVRITYDPTNGEVAAFDRRALCADRAFRNTYAANLRQHVVFTSYHQGTLDDAIGMCVRLGDNVAHECVPTFGGPLKGADAAYAAKEATKMRSELASSS
ncbi:MAG: hypothetical protein HOP91_07430 [Sphingomonas sp.]|nr:hypothetical protein [Sphingomonas sp.]